MSEGAASETPDEQKIRLENLQEFKTRSKTLRCRLTKFNADVDSTKTWIYSLNNMDAEQRQNNMEESTKTHSKFSAKVAALEQDMERLTEASAWIEDKEQLTIYDERETECVEAIIDAKDLLTELAGIMQESTIKEPIRIKTSAIEPAAQRLQAVRLPSQNQQPIRQLQPSEHPQMEAALQQSPDRVIPLDQPHLVQQVKIPKFNGNTWQWNAFWTIFETIVDKDDRLPQIIKFTHLLNHLEGEARELVNRYRVTETNYGRAVKTLQERYDNRASNVSELNRQIKLLKAKDESTRSQRVLWQEVRTIWDQLEEIGEDTENQLLKDLIIEKFSSGIKRKICQKLVKHEDEREWTKSVAEEDIEEIISMEERLGKKMATVSHHKDQNSNKADEQSKKKQNENGNNNKKNSERTRSCLFCKEPHATFKCDKSDYKEKTTILRDQKRCWGCFRNNHKSDDCKSNYLCKNGCQRKHHESLCNKNKTDTRSGSTNESPSQEAKAVVKKVNIANRQTERMQQSNEGLTAPENEGKSFLPTLKVEAFNEKARKYEAVSAMLDSGSDQTYIAESLAQKWDLPTTGTELVQLYTFGSENPTLKECNVTTIKLKVKDDTVELEAYTTPQLTGTVRKARLSEQDMRFIIKEKLLLNEDSTEREVTPELILGIDYLHEIWNGKSISLPSGLRIGETDIGHMVYGKQISTKRANAALQTERTKSPTRRMTLMVHKDQISERSIEEQQKMDTQMKSQEEFSGALSDEKAEMERRTTEHFRKETRRAPEGHYIVRLPFKEDVDLANTPSNKGIAIKRLESVVRSNSKEVLNMIDKVFKEQLEKKIIEKVDPDAAPVGLLRYNPHQPVINLAKTTTPCRVVVDGAAAHKNSPSLNDLIDQGATILPDLQQLLIRFRSGKRVILSDVEKAFLMVHLHEDDRDATRLLWLKDTSKGVTTENTEIFRFTRVLFGLNVSPSLLAHTILLHLESLPDQRFANEIATNLYVDNLIITTDEDPDEAVRWYTLPKQTFADMGMNLRDFATNCPTLLNLIDEKDRAAKMDAKVLGVQWRAEEDELEIRVEVESRTKPSRRIVASTIASNFDPLGLLSPLMLKLKLFQRKLWDTAYEWDTPLTKDHAEEWKQLGEEVNGYEIRIPRAILSKTSENHLVCFSDASKDATAAAIYVIKEGHPAQLLYAKAKVKPLKETWTIPKLETHALAMGSKIAATVIEAIQAGNMRVKEITFLTDSMIALSWVRSNPTRAEVGQLVANRLKAIQDNVKEMTDVEVSFGHVETDKNPADLGTRGYNNVELQEPLWWNGPEFLKGPKAEWPNKGTIFPVNSDYVTVHCNSAKTSTQEMEPILNSNRTNSFRKFKKIAALVLKAIGLMAKGLTKERQELMKTRVPELRANFEGEITAVHIRLAEQLIVKDHQKEITPKKLREMANLRPALNEDGIIVCKGRMGEADLPQSQKEPILIMANSSLSAMIIRDAHGDTHHALDSTMAKVRNKFWIPKLRSGVKKMKQRCTRCQRMGKQPFLYPSMPSMPASRVKVAKPFQTTGLDYFGPITITKDGEDAKCYGAIYTCLVTRLVHVEIVEDETTKEFLQAFRRFVALRGVPKKVLSDNAPTFLLGASILEQASRNNSLAQDVKDFGN